MDQFPTEEEEFELMYNDEMEVLNEMNDAEILNIDKPQSSSKPTTRIEHSQPQPGPSRYTSDLSQPGPSTSKNDFTRSEPQPGPSRYTSDLSQPGASISKNDFTRSEPQPGPSKYTSDLSQPGPSTSKHVFNRSVVQSPQLSQISYDGMAEQSTSELVNRRLFGTPTTSSKRISSTPYTAHSNRNAMAAGRSRGELDTFPNVMTELQNIGVDRKRKRLQDLFGDIEDIIEQEEYVDKEAKKMKNEEERDLDMIEKILEARKKCRVINNPSKKDAADKSIALHAFKMRNLSYTIPNWPCIALERSDQERVYVRMHSESYETKEINEVRVFGQGYRGLLGESKEEIWHGAREITLQRLTASETTTANAEVAIVENPLPKKHEKLWVDKYKPRKYIDLLSDETTNRSLLYWLKMWDKVVFGIEFRVNDTKAGQMSTFNKKTGRFESNGGWQRRNNKQNLNVERDEQGRPMQKVSLLCGPPGLGKTTLAHTIAKHAGYNIREINASDDRSPEAFKTALENGTQMTSVLNADGRPNCIILDEIDGAPIQSIEFLVKFVSDNYTQTAKKVGAKSKKNILKRPIICICNDMYTPALRQLRQISFVVQFPPIESARLAERLLDISYNERMVSDLGTMLALAEKSGNDIRSCISMMQFFHVNKKQLTLHDVLSSSLGQKDRHRGLFGVWSAIFQIQRPRTQLTEEAGDIKNKKNKEIGQITMSDMSQSTRAKHILDVVHMGGDYDRLMQGVHENYLTQKMPDQNLIGVVEAANWFCFSDALQKQINSLQNYSVYPYLQFGFIQWHLLFASLAWPKITFPNKEFESIQKSTTRKLIFQSLKKGISCQSVGIGRGKYVLVETVPLLKRILSPQLRSVSLQLLTTRERNDLKNTVSIMADLGLNFTQIKTIEGTYQYSMEPDLDALCLFEGHHGITLNYFGRQLITREVELEKMRRVAPKITQNQTHHKKPIENNIVQPSTSKDSNTKLLSPPENLPNHLRGLKPKIRQNTNFKETISKDFFGRLTTKQTRLTTKEGGTNSIVKSPVWFRYKQGFNNAVRKDVLMSELL